MSGHGVSLASARLRRPLVRWSGRLALAASILVPSAGLGLAQSASPTRTAPAAEVKTDRGDEYLAVDCLLPSQIRRLGSRVTFLAPRRAVKTTARDCEIRGGEYVSYDRADYATALKVWLAPAEQGDATAQTYVGEIYEKGLGVAPDYAAAAQWYRKAADKGSVRAALNLGSLYERGLGVPRDPRQAAVWYGRASGLPALGFEPVPVASPDDLRKLEAEAQRLRRELQDKQQALGRAQEDAAAARKSLDQLESESQRERAEGERLRRERAQLESVDAKDAAARSRREELGRAIEDSQARLESSEREIATLRDQLARPAPQGQAPDTARLREQLADAEARASLQRAGLEQLKKERDGGGPEVEVIRVQVVEPELLTNTRGTSPSGGSAPLVLIAGRVRPAGGLKSFTINGKEEAPDAQGVFRTRLPLQGSKDEVVRIVAVDHSDRWATLEIDASRRAALTPAVAAPAPIQADLRKQLRVSLGAYHALVIGNDRYANFRPLQTAVPDARAVAAVLRQRYGFTVTVLENATRKQILAELNTLRERLTEKDNLLVYYAGHGELDDQSQRGYWLPVDAQPGAPATWMSNVDLSDILGAMQVRHLLVVADSCYAATLTQAATGRPEPGTTAKDLTKVVEGLAAKRSRLVLTSGGVEPVVDSVGGTHSAFAQVLIDVLQANDGMLLGRDLFARVQLRVHDVALRAALFQVPEYAPIKYAGHEGGDFFFVPAGS